jgi:hypothetical protein
MHRISKRDTLSEDNVDEQQKKAERDTAIEDLKSCMSEDALKDFLISGPSTAVIKSNH